MIAGISKALTTAIFPARCQGCGVLFHPPDTARRQPVSSDLRVMMQADMTALFQEEMAAYLCSECRGRFAAMKNSCCPACGKMFAAVMDQEHACGDCITSTAPYQTVRSVSLLEGTLMDAVHALKYSGKIQLARPLGRMLLAALMREFTIEHIDVIVPVPLHRARLRQRGFNQVVLMLREWPDFPLFQQAGIVIDSRLLTRVVNTASQTGLGRENRKANVRGAFRVACYDRVKNKRILVVDDVYTTGATSAECARVLIKAGAATVSILTLAHAG